ncbi:MAG: hydrogenase maturation nickel metallochaperone HypA [Blastocatellia bacterium]|nr:hydrogenase maturation nickel metallochaperone HypA [Blastocatellia bacterium]
MKWGIILGILIGAAGLFMYSLIEKRINQTSCPGCGFRVSVDSPDRECPRCGFARERNA